MKNRVLTFIIGVLTGAIIATAGFLVYAKVTRNNRQIPPRMNLNGEQMQPNDFRGRGGEMKGMPSEQMGNNNTAAENNN